MICRAIPYNGKDPYIFVSFCHEDSEKIYPLLEQIAEGSYRIWFDDGNQADNNLIDNIENHLEDCNAVVAFISDNFSMSHICKSEIVYAMKCRKKVIPVLIDDAALPKGLHMQLTHLRFLRSTQFSSDGALLHKLFEIEECSVCKAPIGSIPLKEIPSDEHKSDHLSGKNGGILDKLVTIYPQHKIIECKKASNDIPEEEKAAAATPIPDPIDDNETIIDTARNSIGLDNDVTVLVTNRSLALLLHPAGQRAYTIKKPQIKIGRSPIKCDIVIEGNDSISKLHAEIRQYNQKYFLIDSNSANGTFINGESLKSGTQVQLESPSVFQLSDETLILIHDIQARKFIDAGRVDLLINESNTAVRFVDTDILLLNRSNKWPDGTLSDPKIHRSRDGYGHALLTRQAGGIYLIDDCPQGGNGTHLNGRRLGQGECRLLTSGDRILLGDTTLQYISISI